MTTPAPPIPLQIDYIDPDGTDWNLSDLSMANGYICSGIAGIDGIPVTMQTIPLLDGTAIPTIYNVQPGTIAIALLVSRPAGGGSNDYYALLDKVINAFTCRRNELPAPGQIVIQRPDGTSRSVSVYTTSGLDTPEVGLNDMMVYAFTFQTPDPYWYDDTQQNLVFTLNYASGILPLLPIWLAGGTIIGNATINNPGAATYPTWTITGPGTPTIKNLTTGRQWSLNTAIPAGQIVQIVTKRGQQMAVNQSTGSSIWDQLSYSTISDLWSFVTGVNNINISIPGATAATAVSLAWTNRWRRA